MPHVKMKRMLGTIWPAQYKSRKIVLLYHSVGQTPWAMREKIFTEQINWLHDHCQILPLTELIHAQPSENIQVGITFDDGYASLFDNVAEILANKKISATVYINTGWISESQNSRMESKAELGHYPEEFFMTWQEVIALHQAQWEIGSHGVNHYNFTQESNDIVQQELLLSKQQIEKNLNTACIHFAYPWGRYSAYVKKILNTIGYKYAAAAYHAPLKRASDPLALPRINVSTEYAFNDFKQIILGKWDYLGLLHKIKGL